MTRILLAVAVVAAFFPLQAVSAQNDPGTPRRAVLAGHSTMAPDGVTPAERVRLSPDLVASLLALPIEGSVHLLDWPIEPGRRRDVLLTRRDVYAPDARVIAVDRGREIEVPRSRLHFFAGEVEGDTSGRIVVSIDPDTGLLDGHFLANDGWVELRSNDDRGEEYLVAPAAAFAEPGTGALEFDCGTESLPQAPPLGLAPLPSASASPRGTLRRATVAVDTDNELMQLKFGDSTTSATNYIASLFALMTTIYERDLEVRLLEGTTFLRVSTTPDPYEQSGTANADSAKLGEFRSYWNANYAGVPRALAMMLSGKQGSSNSASGIAYVDALCGSFGYSFSQVFKFATNTAANDVQIVAHENGHNFGSFHTHCYLDPTPIDTCYSQEGGCYSGPTSCPAPATIGGIPGVEGTLMSYCHLLGGCSVTNVFHPRIVALLGPIVESRVGECIFVIANPKEASPDHDLHVDRVGSTSVQVSYTPACGATDHTLYTGDLGTLSDSGVSWSQRECFLGNSGSTVVDVGPGSVYFVVVANNETFEGSYGRGTAGERPPAGAGPGCEYTQDLTGSCP